MSTVAPCRLDFRDLPRSEPKTTLHERYDIFQGILAVQLSDDWTEILPVTLGWRIRRPGLRHEGSVEIRSLQVFWPAWFQHILNVRAEECSDPLVCMNSRSIGASVSLHSHDHEGHHEIRERPYEMRLPS